ncbi:MAG: aminotransferase class V-fold PLP-dependent enzyme [Planctomycetes bacterium]|nr:aminotransferase class V-fold PLP-dependent enzyme [Planctomycetota bacterium]
MQLYFDNAATSFPKPDEVLDAMLSYQRSCGASPGRGAYAHAIEATHLLDSCREFICELVNAPSPKHCIFTHNCTDALNLAICGIVSHAVSQEKPIHIVTTAMDHNSVLRPLHSFDSKDVTFTIVQADTSGMVDPLDIKEAITATTALVAVAHGSNVTGSVQDIATIGEICGDVPFLVDAAQTMGHRSIDMESMQIDFLAFPGHKGLLGPLGTGGLIMNPGMENIVAPLRTGGTGSESEFPVQPETLPDKYEPGSHNMVGIAGLLAGVQWILAMGVTNLHEKETQLSEQFIREIQGIEGVRIVGPQTTHNRCGVFSLVFDNCPHEIAKELENTFTLSTRSGLHCAPFAHQTIGTDVLGGTLRISFGPFHNAKDVSYLTQAISHCAQLCLA